MLTSDVQMRKLERSKLRSGYFCAGSRDGFAPPASHNGACDIFTVDEDVSGGGVDPAVIFPADCKVLLNDTHMRYVSGKEVQVGDTYLARLAYNISMHHLPPFLTIVVFYTRVEILNLDTIHKHTRRKVIMSQHNLNPNPNPTNEGKSN